MSKSRYVVKETVQDKPRVVSLEKDSDGVKILVNGKMVCAFWDGRDYLDLYSAYTDTTGLEIDCGFLKVVRL